MNRNHLENLYINNRITLYLLKQLMKKSITEKKSSSGPLTETTIQFTEKSIMIFDHNSLKNNESIEIIDRSKLSLNHHSVKVIDSQRQNGRMVRLTKNELPTIRTEKFVLNRHNIGANNSGFNKTSKKRVEQQLELGYYAKICI